MSGRRLQLHLRVSILRGVRRCFVRRGAARRRRAGGVATCVEIATPSHRHSYEIVGRPTSGFHTGRYGRSAPSRKRRGTSRRTGPSFTRPRSGAARPTCGPSRPTWRSRRRSRRRKEVRWTSSLPGSDGVCRPSPRRSPWRTTAAAAACKVLYILYGGHQVGERSWLSCCRRCFFNRAGYNSPVATARRARCSNFCLPQAPC